MPPSRYGKRCPTFRRANLVLAMMFFILGWGLFAVAGVNASLHTVSHPFRGYEFTGQFVISLSFLVLCLIPRRRDMEITLDEDKYEEIMTWAIGLVLVLTLGGALLAGIIATFEWFIPPPHMVTISNSAKASAIALISGQRGIFSSPSPSPSPRPTRISVPTESDYRTGTLILCSAFALVLSVHFAYAHTTGPTASEVARREAEEGLEMMLRT